jgi:hypothetical protein
MDQSVQAVVKYTKTTKEGSLMDQCRHRLNTQRRHPEKEGSLIDQSASTISG